MEEKSINSTDTTSPTILLGLLSASHLGDALCTTPLPRLLAEKHGKRTVVMDHPSTRGAFANNPYVEGFTQSQKIECHRKLKGGGHIIQRLQRGFQVPVSDTPKPDIYLSSEEIAWAQTQRRSWSNDRPTCILSPRSITESNHFSQIDWPTIAKVWSKHCHLIQPVITQAKNYIQQVAPLPYQEQSQWRSDPLLPDATIYRDLSLRKYLALFSVVDFFCGPLSGGAHVAAAFDLPSLIVIWPSLAKSMAFPCQAPKLSPQCFLYPQHQYIASDRVTRGQVNLQLLENKIKFLTESGHADIQSVTVGEISRRGSQ